MIIYKRQLKLLWMPFFIAILTFVAPVFSGTNVYSQQDSCVFHTTPNADGSLTVEPGTDPDCPGGQNVPVFRADPTTGGVIIRPGDPSSCLQLTKSPDQRCVQPPGGNVNYTITATNRCLYPVENVRIVDVQQGGQTTIYLVGGTLAISESRQFTRQHQISGNAPQDIRNTVTLTGQMNGQAVTVSQTAYVYYRADCANVDFKTCAQQFAQDTIACYGAGGINITRGHITSVGDSGQCLTGGGPHGGHNASAVQYIVNSANTFGTLQCVGWAQAVERECLGRTLQGPPAGNAGSYNCGSDGCSNISNFTFFQNFSSVVPTDLLIFNVNWGGGVSGSIMPIHEISGSNPVNPLICGTHANKNGHGDLHINDCYHPDPTGYIQGYLHYAP